MLKQVFEYMKSEQIELTAEEYLSELIKHIGESNLNDLVDDLTQLHSECTDVLCTYDDISGNELFYTLLDEHNNS
tara:strand:+ start:122 stop:346 length:225 start_codon:yes stop_codon:yes gene_type:complete